MLIGMKAHSQKGISKSLRYMLVAGATLYLVVYAILALFRIPYPFELEWMEGGMVDHVSRILSGQQLYIVPSIEFVPFIYTPLYFYISAVLAGIFGVGLMPLRLVSFISSLGCFFLIYLIVERETRSKFSGLLASGLFAATFRLSGYWYDLARVDSLFLFFFLVALYLIRFKMSAKSWILAGVFISLSFLTKQIALFISLPVMFYCILLDRRRSIFFIGTIVVFTGISTLYLNHINDGWYSFYVFDLPRQHLVLKSLIVGFWTEDLMSKLPIALLVAALYIAAQLKNSSRKKDLFYILLAAGMLGGAWISRLNWGGYRNVLIPAYAAISIIFGLATHSAINLVQDAPAKRRKYMENSIYLLIIIQFAALLYNPVRRIPTGRDLEAGRRFVGTMSQIEGDVFVPNHAYLPTLAGKSSHAHGQAIADILWNDEGEIGASLDNELERAIRDQRFSAIILDNSTWFPIPEQTDVEDYYYLQGPVFDSDTVFWPVTGVPTRPEYIYVPKNSEAN